MHFRVLALSLLFCTPALAQQTAAPEAKMPAPVVFFDIAGPESAKLKDFYGHTFGWNADVMGRVDTGTLKGALRQDLADKVIYLGVPDVTAALKAVEAGGGKIIAPRFKVKGVVVLGLFKDPAGNTMGLVETKDGKPVVP